MLSSLQRSLEHIYEIDVPHDVDDFLITDPAVVRELTGDQDAREIDEKLLVAQDGDCVDVALYLDDAVMQRLSTDDPISRLHDGNIGDFCTALEGVSHFVYLAWNAGHERSVSLLELEMQAEVDKYVTMAFLLGQQASGQVPRALHRWLFDDPTFDSELDRESLERYRDANYYASKYCAMLERRYMRDAKQAELFKDLRRFYRLRQRDKINRIECTA